VRKRNQRLILVAVVVGLMGMSAALALIGLRDSVVYFYAPTDIVTKAEPGKRVRLGGLVEAGSVTRSDGELRFAVTDGAASLPVVYHGAPPDLFREGQGVVCEGVWRGRSVFVADRVLAKHDERYMPREVAEALKQRGEWKGE
jgi:cytochrome c-type biogenesis protein CcmE